MTRTAPWTRIASVAALVTAAAAFSTPAPKPIPLVIYKNPACGCCHKWVDYLQANGFQVTVIDTSNMEPIKARYGVSQNLASCHTAKVGGYVIEGHVPADLIQRLVREHPPVAGLTVPGMVAGSPGMEGPNPQHYDVLSFDPSGNTRVYARR